MIAFSKYSAVFAVGCLLLATTQSRSQQPDNPAVEVLTRGPVHEAFAEPVGLNPQPGPIIPRRPPDPIDELPPEARPEDADAQWIAGYWHWDDERNDFIWVSGVWRVPPEGHLWVPGYFAEAQGGFQRVAGFWAPDNAAELRYFPNPPESLDNGPNGPQPSANHFWVPGCWVYDTRYQWRAGYWAPIVPNWLWVAAHYSWTPRGCVFIDGYWDYPLDNRGLLFAPVYYSQPIYTQPNYVYSPSVFINSQVLNQHFFARPQYQHYYFGDYYGDRYAQAGYYPWFALNTRSYSYDPIYSYRSWDSSRRNPGWYQEHRDRHDHLARHEGDRPPRTWEAQQQLATQRGNDASISNLLVASSLHDAKVNNQSALKLTQLKDQQRQEIKDNTQINRRLAEQRLAVEARAGRDRPDTEPGRTPTLRLPEVAGRRPDSAKPGPGVDRPGIVRPGVDRPDVVRPGTDRPGLDRPDVVRPGTDRPGADRSADRPGVDRPDFVRPDPTRPNNIRPDRPDDKQPVRPDTRPNVPQPGIAPGTPRPDALRNDPARPDRTRPDTTQPGRPDAPRIDPTRPDLRRQDATQPVQPDARPNVPRPGVSPTTPRPDAPRANQPRPDAGRPDSPRPGSQPGFGEDVRSRERTSPQLPPGLTRPNDTAPQPRTTNRLPFDVPQNQANRPVQPQPQASPPAQPRAQPRENRPAPQPRAQAQPNLPAPQPRQQPQVNQPAPPQPRQQPQANRPAPEPRRQPQASPPAAPQQRAQPQANRPAPQPKQQPPQASPPAAQPRPQPQANRPGPQPGGRGGPGPGGKPADKKDKKD